MTMIVAGSFKQKQAQNRFLHYHSHPQKLSLSFPDSTLSTHEFLFIHFYSFLRHEKGKELRLKQQKEGEKNKKITAKNTLSFILPEYNRDKERKCNIMPWKRKEASRIMK
jgi:hypothetical protein